jgi:uncharacterized protein (DUF342 family)
MALKRFDVDVDVFQINAYIIVNPSVGELSAHGLQEPLTVDQIIAALRGQGVVFGLRQDAIEALLSEKRWGEKILVAQGVKPLHGDDGRVEYFFSLGEKPQPKILDDGRVDYRELGLVQMVKKDDLLARLIPPTSGSQGTTVLGRIMPPRPGEAAILKGGQNTYFRDPEKQELCAQETGSVSIIRGVVSVEKTCVIEGDVDFSTGNLDFPGDVIVKGDVKAGFKIRADGKIEIRGIVEDARIESRGDILIRGGFQGSGKGLIRCGGDVHVKFVENQSVEAVGSVYIGEGLLNARIFADDKIFVTNKRGIALGGNLLARRGIIVKALGSPNYMPTVAEILPQETSYPILNNLEIEITLLQAELTALKQVLAKVNHTHATDHDERLALEAEKVKIYDRMDQIKSELPKILAELNSFREKLGSPPPGGTIQVLNKVHPGVKIIMDGLEYELKQDREKTVFKYARTEVVALTPESVVDEDFTW